MGFRGLAVGGSVAKRRRGSSTQVDGRAARSYLLLKRLVDFTAALVGLVVLSPLLLFLAVLVRLDSPGPAFFTQERVGYDPRTGRPRTFRILKFRTMCQDADEAVHRAYVRDLIQQDTAPSGGHGSLKMAGDRRITRLGCWLRRTSVDELPQLVNVLRGEMSLVGPRPALPYEVELYQDWQRRRLEARPGMSGWWQVSGRNRVSFDDGMRMDIYYIDHQGFWLDLKILCLTPWAVITGRGAG